MKPLFILLQTKSTFTTHLDNNILIHLYISGSKRFSVSRVLDDRTCLQALMGLVTPIRVDVYHIHGSVYPVPSIQGYGYIAVAGRDNACYCTPQVDPYKLRLRLLARLGYKSKRTTRYGIEVMRQDAKECRDNVLSSRQ
ncbi:hypothetical protein KQX54_007894 [Cotesia glomerata]|uniref:Uncharacterized protein n=1 Tax=Cotesia glomerata TaxID=32391 RepID=A0AAV7HC68_COTGL|nr:hypothetical protein KQX54_007894 [Cotesia glomerata]